MFNEPARDAPMGSIEAWMSEMGIHSLIGIDEAGRGPLAGPVAAAAVSLPRTLPPELFKLDDSKKLDEAARDELAPIIRAVALGYGVAVVDHEKIDEINILEATKLAWRHAYDDCVEQLGHKPQGLLVDGNLAMPNFQGQQWALVKGDGRSYNIAAASILAKTHRDALMVKHDAIWPEYGFARHKGYGTIAHRRALMKHGRCPIHRMSFKWTPVVD